MSFTYNDIHKRPRISWDIRQFAETEGKGSQEDYVNAAKSCSSFHNRFPETNSNEMMAVFCGITLHSHLYGRAQDLCNDIPSSEIESDDVVDKICKALQNKDAPSVVSNAYSDFLTVLSRKRGISEIHQILNQYLR